MLAQDSSSAFCGCASDWFQITTGCSSCITLGLLHKPVLCNPPSYVRMCLYLFIYSGMCTLTQYSCKESSAWGHGTNSAPNPEGLNS